MQILQALAHMTSLGIVHRGKAGAAARARETDEPQRSQTLKHLAWYDCSDLLGIADSVALDANGNVKIADFGLSVRHAAGNTLCLLGPDRPPI